MRLLAALLLFAGIVYATETVRCTAKVYVHPRIVADIADDGTTNSVVTNWAGNIRVVREGKIGEPQFYLEVPDYAACTNNPALVVAAAEAKFLEWPKQAGLDETWVFVGWNVVERREPQ